MPVITIGAIPWRERANGPGVMLQSPGGRNLHVGRL